MNPPALRGRGIFVVWTSHGARCLAPSPTKPSASGATGSTDAARSAICRGTGSRPSCGGCRRLRGRERGEGKACAGRPGGRERECISEGQIVLDLSVASVTFCSIPIWVEGARSAHHVPPQDGTQMRMIFSVGILRGAGGGAISEGGAMARRNGCAGVDVFSGGGRWVGARRPRRRPEPEKPGIGP